MNLVVITKMVTESVLDQKLSFTSAPFVSILAPDSAADLRINCPKFAAGNLTKPERGEPETTSFAVSTP